MVQAFGWHLGQGSSSEIFIHTCVRGICALDPAFHDIADLFPSVNGCGVQCVRHRDHVIIHYFHPAGPYYFIIDQHGREIRSVSLAENVVDVETLLTGTVMALVSRLRGRLTLHGAAISIGDRLIGLLAEKGMGKSTTALALLQRGHALLSDDIISLEMPAGIAHPGLPESRQTLGTLAAFDMDPADHEPVFRAEPAETQDKRTIALTGGRSSMFCPTAKTLEAIYLLQRSSTVHTQSIVPLAPVQSLRGLLGHISFAPHPLMEGEFDMLGQLVRAIPVRQVSYPSDLAQLDRLCTALEEDVQSLSAMDQA